MDPSRWNERIALAVGVGFGFLLGVAVVASPLKAVFISPDGRLQWETLLAGILALFGAWLTVKKIAEQIRQASDQAADALTRKKRAALASLPLALSEVGHYSERCIRGLSQTRNNTSPTELNDLSLPPGVLATIKECIEFADGPAVDALIQLVRFFQVQNLRLVEDLGRLRAGDSARPLIWHQVESDMCDAAELWSRAAVLFPFARGEPVALVEPTRNEVFNAFLNAGCFNNSHDLDRLADAWLASYQAEKAKKSAGLTAGLGVS